MTIKVTSVPEFERLSIPGLDLTLAADAAGPVNAPTILFLHGSGQTRQSWSGALAEAIKRAGYATVSRAEVHGKSG